MILNTSKSTGVKFSYSQIFDEGAELQATLKNPNQFKEAVIYEHLSHLSPSKLKVFVGSAEARAMVEAGSISYDTLDRLSNKCDEDKCAIKTAVCHIAKENEDELWNDLVKARAEERRIMNELMNKYRTEADPLAINARNDIINRYVPETYK